MMELPPCHGSKWGFANVLFWDGGLEFHLITLRLGGASNVFRYFSNVGKSKAAVCFRTLEIAVVTLLTAPD